MTNMKPLTIGRAIGLALDLGIDLSLKIVGMYLFFYEHDFQQGAILLLASGVYCISMYCGHLMHKENKQL